jgi:DNA-binding HxlR family transcriptional regulator
MKSGFGQICPVAAACEVFAQRWTPIILRELFAGSQHFNEIHRGAPLMSRALLVSRLRSLEAHGVIVREATASGRGHCYRLTDSGREFKSVIEGLGTWGQRWTVRVELGNLNASFLMWNVRRRIARERLPEHRVVVRFKFLGVPARSRSPRTFWLLLERMDVDLCIRDPGFEVDLCVEADLATMAKVWLGDLTMDAVLKSAKVRLTGSKELVREFPRWLMLSPFAEVPRPV